MGNRIPIPLRQRWQRFRYQLLPMVIFSVGIVVTCWLWQRQGRQPNAIGAVEAVRVEAACSRDGVVVPLGRPHWSLFESVRAGELIARLDDRPVRAQLRTLQAQLLRIRAEVPAAESQLVLEDAERLSDHRRESARLAWRVEQLRLNVLDRRTAIQVDRVELKRRQIRINALEPLVPQNAVPRLEFLEEQLLHARLSEQIKENLIAISEAKLEEQQNALRLEAFPKPIQAELQRLLAPLRADISVQEAKIDEVRLQVDSLDILAPISGTVTIVHAWPGQAVTAGDPIVTIASEHGRYIVSYIRQSQRIEQRVNTPVLLRLRGSRESSTTSLIDLLGPQFEPIPPHLLRDPSVSEWGRPVRIRIPSQLAHCPPGSLVDITFDRPVKRLE